MTLWFFDFLTFWLFDFAIRSEIAVSFVFYSHFVSSGLLLILCCLDIPVLLNYYAFLLRFGVFLRVYFCCVGCFILEWFGSTVAMLCSSFNFKLPILQFYLWKMSFWKACVVWLSCTGYPMLAILILGKNNPTRDLPKPFLVWTNLWIDLWTNLWTNLTV